MPLVLDRLFPGQTLERRVPADPAGLARLRAAEGGAWAAAGVPQCAQRRERAAYVQDKVPIYFDAYNEAVYRAFWERSEDIGDLTVLGSLAESVGLSTTHFLAAIFSKAYYDEIVRFDDDAYAADVRHVPTFIFQGERCAEAPYATIHELAERHVIWYDKA